MRQRSRESLGALGEVFANPALRRIQLANAGSIVGGWSYVVALAVFAYQEDGAYAVGLLATVRWLCRRRSLRPVRGHRSATATRASA